MSRIRHRDTIKQDRVAISELRGIINEEKYETGFEYLMKIYETPSALGGVFVYIY